jgi:trehalose/maltose transport system permease protein
MTAQALSPERRDDNPAGINNLLAILVALLFVALGIGAFLVIFSNINNVLALRAEGEATGATVLRFLNSYGIIVPLILVGLGVYFIRLGIRLFRRDASSAAWARQLLLWLGVAAIVLFLQAFNTGASGIDGTLGRGIELALPYAIGSVIIFVALWWMTNNQQIYHGMETLAETSSRTAWNLLLPTIAVLVVVAMRPLEATFVASLTDREFASAREPNFIGLDNYSRLLGLRIDTIPCERDEAGACALDRNGETDFPSPRSYYQDTGSDPSYRALGFDPVSRWTVGENQIVISARDADFVEATGDTLVFTIFSVLLELILGLGIALIINSKFTGRGLLRTAMLVPWAIPTVVSARLWEIMLRPNQSGVVNHFFVNVIPIFGESQAWLAADALQLPALIAIDVWKTTPFMALILLAGLQVIPSDVYEAADVDGASKLRQFFNITLPLLRPTIAVALVFRTLDAIRVFDLFQVLLDGRDSMATYNYGVLVQRQEFGYASAVGVVIFIIILLFAVTYVRILGVNRE